MLGDILRAEISRLGEFIDLLQREQELLIRGDTEALLLLSENKTALANALAALSQAREGQLVTDAHTPAWQTLRELAAKAKNLNETNGKLIGLHLQHNQQAFAVLMAAANRAMNYGPDGQQKIGLGGRILGSA